MLSSACLSWSYNGYNCSHLSSLAYYYCTMPRWDGYFRLCQYYRAKNVTISCFLFCTSCTPFILLNRLKIYSKTSLRIGTLAITVTMSVRSNEKTQKYLAGYWDQLVGQSIEEINLEHDKPDLTFTNSRKLSWNHNSVSDQKDE